MWIFPSYCHLTSLVNQTKFTFDWIQNRVSEMNSMSPKDPTLQVQNQEKKKKNEISQSPINRKSEGAIGKFILTAITAMQWIPGSVALLRGVRMIASLFLVPPKKFEGRSLRLEETVQARGRKPVKRLSIARGIGENSTECVFWVGREGIEVFEKIKLPRPMPGLLPTLSFCFIYWRSSIIQIWNIFLFIYSFL